MEEEHHAIMIRHKVEGEKLANLTSPKDSK